MGEVASLSKFAIETGNVLSEMERYMGHFLNLQESLIAYSKDQSEETDKAFATFVDSIGETEITVSKLRGSGSGTDTLSKAMRDMKLSVGEFRLGELQSETTEAEDSPEPNTYSRETRMPSPVPTAAKKEFQIHRFGQSDADQINRSGST